MAFLTMLMIQLFVNGRLELLLNSHTRGINMSEVGQVLCFCDPAGVLRARQTPNFCCFQAMIA